MPALYSPRRLRRISRAFTLVELLVSITVLILLIGIIGQIFNAAAATTTAGNTHMNCDLQARAVLDRMAVDFGQIVIRSDVDYFSKSPSVPQVGNDQIAFFCQTPGYYPAIGARSPSSLVAYRINSDSAATANLDRMQRMGKGLLWNGASTTFPPISFLPLTIADTWPAATNMQVDGDYELIGAQVFRFEYNYLLRGQTVAGNSYVAAQSDVPWDTRIPGHASVNGFQDVSALTVYLAVIDARDRNLLSSSQVEGLAKTMPDFHPDSQDPTKPVELKPQWQAILDSPSNGIPRAISARVRLYSRSYYLKERSSAL